MVREVIAHASNDGEIVVVLLGYETKCMRTNDLLVEATQWTKRREQFVADFLVDHLPAKVDGKVFVYETSRKHTCSSV